MLQGSSSKSFDATSRVSRLGTHSRARLSRHMQGDPTFSHIRLLQRRSWDC